MKEDVSAGVERMKTVLFSMYRENKITKEQYEEALAYDITRTSFLQKSYFKPSIILIIKLFIVKR